MNQIYVIYDCIRKKYVSQIIKLPHPNGPFLAIKFGDVYSAIAFDYYCLAKDMVDEIYSWFLRTFQKRK